MAVKPVLICDVCGKDGDTEIYKVVFPDGTIWEVDLCGQHNKPLERFRLEGIGQETKGRGRRRTFEVTTIEAVQGRTRRRP